MYNLMLTFSMTALPNAPEQPGEVEQVVAGARLRMLVRLLGFAN